MYAMPASYVRRDAFDAAASAAAIAASSAASERARATAATVDPEGVCGMRVTAKNTALPHTYAHADRAAHNAH
jgi:hypothetical protein